MTDIKQKALALLNDVRTERGFAPVVELYGSVFLGEVLCRALEQHEAFRQEVSDVVEQYVHASGKEGVDEWVNLKSLIIAKPDPLVRVINEVIYAQPHGDIDEVRMADDFRAALEARGLEIKEISK